MTSAEKRPKIGLALGAGAARGWAHIGIIDALRQRGVEAQVVCGTSIGSLVGAAEAGGELRALRRWVLSLTWQDVLGFLDVSLDGGLIRGRKLEEFFGQYFPDRPIDRLSKRYGAVAVNLASGEEVRLIEGSLFQAVRASCSLPGLFSPHRLGDRWLVDGGMANPVPVSLCRQLGADRVIAVDLNGTLLKRRPLPGFHPTDTANKQETEALNRIERWWQEAQQWTQRLSKVPETPGLLDTLARTVYIAEIQITRCRLGHEPPDLLLEPRVEDLALLDFHRAGEALKAGERCVEAVADRLGDLLAPVESD